MAGQTDEALRQIEYEVVNLMRRADFKKTLDGQASSLPRSCYLILCRLLEENPQSILQLAECFQLDVSTMSRQVKALESRALVSRRTGKRDGRVSLIYITEKGEKSVTELRVKRVQIYGRLLADWTGEEQLIFAGLLARLNRKIEKRRKLK
ncbi:MAG: MarR family winged helix-turn-helix transcriptional regulator [Sporolactobacillus sp.]